MDTEEFESSAEYQALVVAAAGKPERSMGESVIPAEPPVWNDVRKLAQQLGNGDIQHLAVLVHLARAETNTNGFAGLAAALEQIRDQINDHWDALLPEADADDPDDPYYARVNLLHEMSEQPGFLNELFTIPLVSARGIGEFSTRDIAIAQGRIEGSEEESAHAQDGLIRGAFQESGADVLSAGLQALEQTLACAEQIETLFAEKSDNKGDVSLLNFTNRVRECLAAYRGYADELMPVDAPEAAEHSDAETSGTSGLPSTSNAQSPDTNTASSLATRQAVLQAFSEVIAYYRQHEPSSPLLFFAQRASGMVSKTFFDLLQELAPAHRDDLPGLLNALKNNPMNFLVQDSYQRFLSGDLGVSDQSGEVAEPVSTGEQQGVQNRQQVQETLLEIERFFIANEPASPIPLLIAEMRKLVDKRFADLLSEFSRSMPVSKNEAGEDAE